ncbi:hypothetical protein T484DRAFT_1828168, partial [Baffinella frigidus]
VREIILDDTMVEYDITHRELVELFGLQPRHLRAGIIPYDDMVVFKFEHLKGLLFWDRIMVFDSDTPSVEAFILTLRAAIRRNQAFILTLRAAIRCNQVIFEQLKQPFELVVLECLLDELASYYESSFSRLHALISVHLDNITSGLGDEVREDGLYKLLPLENKLSSLQVRLDRTFKTLDQLIATDEDMAACYLTFRQETGAPAPPDEHMQETGAPAPPDEHMQVELVMETYRTRMEDLLDRIAEIGRQIESTRAVYALSLDNTRNRIAKMDLRLSIAAVSLGFSMTVAGFFGMNVTHGAENVSPLVFAGVVVAAVGTSACITLLGLPSRVVVAAVGTSACITLMGLSQLKNSSRLQSKRMQIHFLLRADPDLSLRLSEGDKLTKEELQALIAACPPPVTATQMAPPARAEDTAREVALLDQILSSSEERLIERSAFLDELSRWARTAMRP